MASKGYEAGVKEYREKYWTPEYVPLDTDLLACFKVTGQPGVPREEVAAAVAEHSASGRTEVAEALALFYAEGDYREARRRVADWWAGLASATYVSPWSIAWQYSAAGEDSLAFDWLERGYEERDPVMPYLTVAPGFGRLRDAPRFQDIVRRMGLPR